MSKIFVDIMKGISFRGMTVTYIVVQRNLYLINPYRSGRYTKDLIMSTRIGNHGVWEEISMNVSSTLLVEG